MAVVGDRVQLRNFRFKAGFLVQLTGVAMLVAVGSVREAEGWVRFLGTVGDDGPALGQLAGAIWSLCRVQEPLPEWSWT